MSDFFPRCSYLCLNPPFFQSKSWFYIVPFARKTMPLEFQWSCSRTSCSKKLLLFLTAVYISDQKNVFPVGILLRFKYFWIGCLKYCNIVWPLLICTCSQWNTIPEGVWGNRGMAPYISKLGTRLKWVDNLSRGNGTPGSVALWGPVPAWIW